MRDITLDDQLACLRREIAMLKSVYPKWVRMGKMKEDRAEREIEVMQSVLDLLTEMKRDDSPADEAIDA